MANNADEPFNMRRFFDAQARVYASVLDELRAGRKQTHWMWFIFPQIEGLGTSGMAKRYAIASLSEAVAFAEHALLGLRLRECTEQLLGHPYRSAADIFGFPDDRKLHSSMTLFAQAVPQEKLFSSALEQFFDAKKDSKTIELLARG